MWHWRFNGSPQGQKWRHALQIQICHLEHVLPWWVCMWENTDFRGKKSTVLTHSLQIQVQVFHVEHSVWFDDANVAIRLLFLSHYCFHSVDQNIRSITWCVWSPSFIKLFFLIWSESESVLLTMFVCTYMDFYSGFKLLSVYNFQEDRNRHTEKTRTTKLKKNEVKLN